MNRSPILHIVLILTIGSSALCAMTTEEKATAAGVAIGTSQAPHVCEKCSSSEIPLKDAAFYDHTDCMRALIDSKTDVHVQDNLGFTPLHWAAHEGRTDSVGILIAAGANVNLKNKNGTTALLVAAQQAIVHQSYLRSERSASHAVRLLENKNCIKLLLRAGAECNLGPVMLEDSASPDFKAYTKYAQEGFQAIVDECARELAAVASVPAQVPAQ